MIIDLEPILSGKKQLIDIDSNLNIPEDLLIKSEIVSLKDVKFVGKIKRLIENITLEAKLEGIMILKDDLTLENVEYNFNIDIEEEIDEEIVESKFDLIKFIWQFIQVEIPSKIITDRTLDHQEGDGWRLISEDDNKNYAFKDLDKLIKERSQ